MHRSPVQCECLLPQQEVYRFLSGYTATAPVGLQTVQQASWDWVWTRTEEGLVEGMFTGLAVCFPVAFLVLAGATGNIVVALYAIVSICFVVASVLGVVQVRTASRIAWQACVVLHSHIAGLRLFCFLAAVPWVGSWHFRVHCCRHCHWFQV